MWRGGWGKTRGCEVVLIPSLKEGGAPTSYRSAPHQWPCVSWQIFEMILSMVLCCGIRNSSVYWDMRAGEGKGGAGRTALEGTPSATKWPGDISTKDKETYVYKYFQYYHTVLIIFLLKYFFFFLINKTFPYPCGWVSYTSVLCDRESCCSRRSSPSSPFPTPKNQKYCWWRMYRGEGCSLFSKIFALVFTLFQHGLLFFFF